jgi:Tol biopolymer transport system component
LHAGATIFRRITNQQEGATQHLSPSGLATLIAAMNKKPSIAWDVFIAYPSGAEDCADGLFRSLCTYGRVFLDRSCLQPGDIWVQRLRIEQDRARCTVVLITENTDKTWFTYSEYVHAIELARIGDHRIIPILIGKASKLPYGLEQVQALRLEDGADFTPVCRQIVAALETEPVGGLQEPKDIIAESARDEAEQGRATTGQNTRSIKSPRLGSRWAALLMLLALAGIVAFRVYQAPPVIAGPERITTSGNAITASISVDGLYVAYAATEKGGQGLRVRHVHGEMDKEIVPAADGEITGITFSKDLLIYYVFSQKERGKLYSIPIMGGEPKFLIDDVDSAISISPDGKKFVFRRQELDKSKLVIYNIPDQKEERVLKVLEDPDHFWSTPLWSPDGDFIVSEIFNTSFPYLKLLSVHLKDRREQTITLRPGSWYWMNRPTFIRKGRSIAVAAASAGSGRSQLIEISWPGGSVRNISNDLTDYADLDSTPDSDLLLAIERDRLSGIWLIPLANPEKAHAVNLPASRMSYITWSPEGKLILEAEAHGRVGLRSVDPSSGEVEDLTNDAYMEFSPLVSPDRQYLLFSSNRDGQVHLWRAHRNGREPERLTDQSAMEEEAAITPDSQWVVYTSNQSGFPALWKISIKGGRATKLTLQPAQRPAISPNGQMIACEFSNDPREGWSIGILSAETGKLLRLIPNIPAGHSALPVQWSGDNRSLYYVKTENNTSNIWEQPIDGGVPRQLTHFGENLIFAFSLSTNGKLLACIRGTEASDVVLLKQQ